MIRAHCASDDGVVEIDFDATSWFERVSDEKIVKLGRIGWGFDYEADEVAWFFADAETRELFSYLENVNVFRVVGFECHVNGSDALVWIRRHRPHLEAEITVSARKRWGS